MHVTESVASIPGHQLAGGRIREVLIRFLDSRPGLADQLTMSLGTPGAVSDILSDADLQGIRQQVAQLVTSECPQGGTIVDLPTGLQGHLLHRRATWAGVSRRSNCRMALGRSAGGSRGSLHAGWHSGTGHLRSARRSESALDRSGPFCQLLRRGVGSEGPGHFGRLHPKWLGQGVRDTG